MITREQPYNDFLKGKTFTTNVSKQPFVFGEWTENPKTGRSYIEILGVNKNKNPFVTLKYINEKLLNNFWIITHSKDRKMIYILTREQENGISVMIKHFTEDDDIDLLDNILYNGCYNYSEKFILNHARDLYHNGKTR